MGKKGSRKASKRQLKKGEGNVEMGEGQKGNEYQLRRKDREKRRREE